MVRAPIARQPAADPTRDAASLLRRLGFILLFGGFPVATIVGPSTAVAIFVIGVLLVSSPGLLTGQIVPRADRVAALLASPGLIASIVLAAWTLVSLAWTPVPSYSARALGGLAAILALGASAYVALPRRMRSANLYLVPIGTTIAAAAAVALALTTRRTDADLLRQLALGIGVLVVFAWPAIAWLRSRSRDGEAIALAMLIAAVAAWGAGPAPIVALALGAGAFLVAQLSTRAGAALVAGAASLAILLAPSLLLLPPALVPSGLLGPDWAAGFEAWRAALQSEPARLVTGRGFGAIRRTGLFLDGAGFPVLALWFELGIVGALASATLCWASMSVALRAGGVLVPGLCGAYATAFALAAAGLGGTAPWWSAALVVACLAFVAIARGQARTRRPRLTLLRRGSLDAEA